MLVNPIVLEKDKTHGTEGRVEFSHLRTAGQIDGFRENTAEVNYGN